MELKLGGSGSRQMGHCFMIVEHSPGTRDLYGVRTVLVAISATEMQESICLSRQMFVLSQNKVSACSLTSKGPTIAPGSERVPVDQKLSLGSDSHRERYESRFLSLRLARNELVDYDNGTLR